MDRGLARADELPEIAAGWRAWAASEDGWFALLHGELLCRVAAREPGDARRQACHAGSVSSATVYWRPGCPFCVKLRLGLRLTRTPHTLVNVWEDAGASTFVKQHNGGDELVPTVAVGERVLSNPSVRDVQRALAGR